jgi:hypothetical protein
MSKKSLVALHALLALLLGVWTLGVWTLADAQQPSSPPVVQWQLDVMRDGQQIDTFDGNTTVGQSQTDTHHHVVQHDVGCKDSPGGSIDLARTLTVSPISADASSVTLAIDAHETLEGDHPAHTDTGCALPPQPRLVTASHPGLQIPAGQWVSWTIVDQNPSLVYRVRASVASQP